MRMTIQHQPAGRPDVDESVGIPRPLDRKSTMREQRNREKRHVDDRHHKQTLSSAGAMAGCGAAMLGTDSGVAMRIPFRALAQARRSHQ